MWVSFCCDFSHQSRCIHNDRNDSQVESWKILEIHYSSKMNLKSRLTTIDSWRTFASWPILGPASNRKTRIWRSVKYRTNELGFIWVIIYDLILDLLHDLTLDDIYVSMFGRYQKRNVPLNFFEMESFEPYLYYWDDLFFQWCFNKKNLFCIFFIHFNANHLNK